ncbi:MAG: MBL fold metallo-hydrolase [Clostridia bacterium]|nr:MBL fold metallo-hydrolase [Clostridia bacterium]
MEEQKNLTAEEMLASMQQLHDEAKQYYTDARRYRDEARRCRDEARNSRVAAQLQAEFMEKEKANWVTDGIPKPPGFYAYYGAGGDSYVLYQSVSSKGQFDGYCNSLLNAGFTKHYDSVEGKAFYALYYNDQAIVNVSFSSVDNALRVTVDHRSKSALPPVAPICDGVPNSTEPKLMLFGDHMYEICDCGMGYVFRLTDGSFVIIDGGMPWPATIPEAFYDRLVELAEGKRIVVSAWILTHAHPDHTRVYVELSKSHGVDIDVRRVIYNFPGCLMQLGSTHRNWCENEVRFVEEANARYASKPEFIRAYTGQHYQLPDMQIDMLFTLDDFKQPFFPLNFNATSLIFRITAMGQTFMFLGDGDPTSIGILSAKYGSALKSDVVQVAHHGYYGGTKEGYDLIDAPIVLWPVPWYHPKNNSLRYASPDFSPVTREMIRDHARVVYIQAKGTDILPLPLNGEDGTTQSSPEDYPNKYWPEWKA